MVATPLICGYDLYGCYTTIVYMAATPLVCIEDLHGCYNTRIPLGGCISRVSTWFLPTDIPLGPTFYTIVISRGPTCLL